MKRSVNIVIVFWALLSLTSCAIFNHYFPDKRLRYQTHESRADIVLPDGMSSSRMNNAMPVPEISPALQDVSLPEDVERPAPLQIGMMMSGVQKRSTGERQWLYLDKAAGQVWPELERYFNSHSIPVAVSDGRRGEIQSQALPLSHPFLSSLDFDKAALDAESKPDNGFVMSLKLQPGFQRNTSRLDLMMASNNAQTMGGSLQMSLENSVLDDLAQYLGEELEKQSSVSLLAQQMSRSLEFSLVEESEQVEHVFINQDFNHGWYLVSRAIREAEMPLFDINRSLGVFYLSTAHPDAGQYSFTRQINRQPGFDSLKQHGDFQIYVQESEVGTEVRVRVSDGVPADGAFSHFILSNLLESLRNLEH